MLETELKKNTAALEALTAAILAQGVSTTAVAPAEEEAPTKAETKPEIVEKPDSKPAAKKADAPEPAATTTPAPAKEEPAAVVKQDVIDALRNASIAYRSRTEGASQQDVRGAVVAVMAKAGEGVARMDDLPESLYGAVHAALVAFAEVA